jgi:hypothetical protein
MSTNLGGKELYKYPKGGTKDRVPVFLSKYENGNPFELINGQTVTFVVDKVIIEAVKKRQELKNLLLIDKNKKTYKFTQLKKTKEFGGGAGGTSAGSEDTSLNESAQAVYAAAKWSKKNTTYSSQELTRAYTKSDVTEPLKNILNNLPGDWVHSSRAGAERLYEEFGSNSKSYTFHRGSLWVKKLQDHFLKLNRQIREFSNVNKWSPADIYLVSPAGSRVDYTKTNSIVELNNLLKDNLASGDIIGVSLKKIESSEAKLDYLNFGKKKPTVKFTGYNVAKKNFFSSKDVVIKYTVDGEIAFRTFTVDPSSFSGEISGTSAQQGKIGLGPCYKLIEKLSKSRRLTNARKVKTSIENGDETTLKTFYSYYLKYDEKDSIKLKYEDFISKYNEKGPDRTSWAYSKYLGCELIDIIIGEKIEDKFVSGAVQYASSQSDLSAPYVKVEGK